MKRLIVVAAAIAAGVVPAAALAGGPAWGSTNLCVSASGTPIIQRGTATCNTADTKSVAVSTGSGANAVAFATHDRAVATGSGSDATVACGLICFDPTNSTAVGTGQSSSASVGGCGFCNSTKNAAVATTPGCNTGEVSGPKQSAHC